MTACGLNLGSLHQIGNYVSAQEGNDAGGVFSEEVFYPVRCPNADFSGETG